MLTTLAVFAWPCVDIDLFVFFDVFRAVFNSPPSRDGRESPSKYTPKKLTCSPKNGVMKTLVPQDVVFVGSKSHEKSVHVYMDYIYTIIYICFGDSGGLHVGDEKLWLASIVKADPPGPLLEKLRSRRHN